MALILVLECLVPKLCWQLQLPKLYIASCLNSRFPANQLRKYGSISFSFTLDSDERVQICVDIQKDKVFIVQLLNRLAINISKVKSFILILEGYSFIVTYFLAFTVYTFPLFHTSIIQQPLQGRPRGSGRLSWVVIPTHMFISPSGINCRTLNRTGLYFIQTICLKIILTRFSKHLRGGDHAGKARKENFQNLQNVEHFDQHLLTLLRLVVLDNIEICMSWIFF